MEGLIRGEDQKLRCWWCTAQEDYRIYHDQEWGRPVAQDQLLFEKLCLEGFQAGLSWLTILRKREHFRQAFQGFDFQVIAHYGSTEVETLQQNPGIVRHRKKIESVINNAQRACELVQEYGSLARYFWSFEPDPHLRPMQLDYMTLVDLSQTETSRALSRDLKKRGWSFVGPNTVYAFMQAMGLVNDHLQGCDLRSEVEQERQRFARPT